MDYAPYVLFHDAHNSKREVYCARDTDGNALTTVPIPAAALRFETAREAYDFGAEHSLWWWRVGKR
jgi:hypothetical protein